MPEFDPYNVLGVPKDADVDAIEDAYDRLFDRYEPKALAGDKKATAMLERLNSAREVLVDPAQRAAFDAQLTEGTQEARVQAPTMSPSEPAPSLSPQPAPSRKVAARYVTTAPRPEARESVKQSVQTDTERMRVRRRAQERPRSVAPLPQRSPLPYVLVGALALALVAAGLLFVLTGNQAALQPAANLDRGAIVATVNGAPIYEQDFNERVEIDKQIALSDPFFNVLLNNFQGFTGTRALQVLRFDSLDKLINLEVIVQQARKEGLYPDEGQQQTLINEAKAGELGSETFESFLARRGITAEQYNRRVIQNVVYTVMANEHLPKEGDANARSEGFIRWICDTRKAYDAKINLTFQVAGTPPMEHTPCTSGLPTDLPLPGLEQLPEPEETAPVPIQPQGTPAPDVTPSQQ